MHFSAIHPLRSFLSPCLLSLSFHFTFPPIPNPSPHLTLHAFTLHPTSYSQPFTSPHPSPHLTLHPTYYSQPFTSPHPSPRLLFPTLHLTSPSMHSPFTPPPILHFSVLITHSHLTTLQPLILCHPVPSPLSSPVPSPASTGPFCHDPWHSEENALSV